MIPENRPLRYLSTLAFTEEWLDQLRAAVPGIVVQQITATHPDDIPADVWESTDVLHTSVVLPRPGTTPNLRWVQLDTSGVDHVRADPIWSADLPLTTIGGISPVPLAEYVLWAVLGAAHRLPAMLDVRQTRVWPDPATRWQNFLPTSLAGATIVIVGYGRIGREIGRLARTHAMNVVGVSRSGASVTDRGPLADFAPPPGDDDGGVYLVGPDRLLECAAAADYLVVVVPLTEQTRGMISAEVLAALPRGAVVINVARGGIVDEAALRRGLLTGGIRSAVLDVFDDEPLAADSPWWDTPNCFITPHVSGLAAHYSDQVLTLVARNLQRFVAGEPLLNLVDRGRGY